MEQVIRYFIIPINEQTSSCPEDETLNHCRVIDWKYREIFNFLLDSKDTKVFLKIINCNKNALLYRTHDILGEMAYWKIDKLHKTMIYNGLTYP